MTPDNIDLNIIEALQEDGRITNKALADRVALSPSACLERLKKLEKHGYILGYHADVAADKIMSYSAVLVEITLENHRSEDFRRFEAAIDGIPEIVECYAVGGGIDYIVKFVARSIEHYQHMMDDMLGGDIGIDRYFSYFITKRTKSAPYPVKKFARRAK